jgi:DNA replication and repair protein RecF
MILEKLELQDFRNIASAGLTFESHINLFFGENGQGKTSILEAIFTLCFSRSFRERSDSVIVRHKKRGYRITGDFKDREKEFQLKTVYSEGKKNLFINSSPIKKSSELLGLVPVVVLTPADLKLTEGGPAERRKFFDVILSQVYPSYLRALQKFREALKQKNEILNSRIIYPHERELISAWNEVIAEQVSLIVSKRKEFTGWLNKHSEEAYNRISGKEHTMRVEYSPILAGTPEEISGELEKKLPEEIEKKQALFGPQRDEVNVILNDHPIRQTGSQGENKTAVITLKLLEIKYLNQYRNTSPLILFDDIFSELDRFRTENLIRGVGKLGQVFITSTVRRFEGIDSYPFRLFKVHNGDVRAV